MINQPKLLNTTISAKLILCKWKAQSYPSAVLPTSSSAITLWKEKNPRTKGVRAKPKDMKNARCAEGHFPQGSALSCLSSFAAWGRGTAVGRTTTFSLHIQHWSAHLSDRRWASGSSPRISPAHASPWRISILGSGPMLLSGVTAQRPEDSAESLKLLLAGKRRGGRFHVDASRQAGRKE